MLSLGQRMRRELAVALLHPPQIAFLDEPTIGLDVLVKVRMREHRAKCETQFNMTVMSATHDFKDITTPCDRIIALDKWRLLHDGNFQLFKQRFGTELCLWQREPVASAARSTIGGNRVGAACHGNLEGALNRSQSTGG